MQASAPRDLPTSAEAALRLCPQPSVRERPRNKMPEGAFGEVLGRACAEVPSGSRGEVHAGTLPEMLGRAKGTLPR